MQNNLLLPRLRRRRAIGEHADEGDQQAKERNLFHLRLRVWSRTWKRGRGGGGSSACPCRPAKAAVFYGIFMARRTIQIEILRRGARQLGPPALAAIAPAAMLTVSASSAALKKNETMPWALTVRRISREETATS